MVYKSVIEGKYVNLKACEIEDAEYTLAIRQNPKYKEAIPLIKGTVDQQKEWIKKQRDSLDDYFFVVWDKANNRIGTIGLYDIKDNQCESGRIIIEGNPMQSIEAQLLLDDFGFDVLKMNYIVSYIYSDNDRALRFSKQFGGTFENEHVYKNGKEMLKKINTPVEFARAKERLVRMLYR